MASLTGRSGGNVRRWFPLSSRTVMTRSTTGGDAGVIHRTSAKCCGRFMASFTGCSGGNVRRWFPLSGRTVMTRSTTGGDTGVVHCGTGKA